LQDISFQIERGDIFGVIGRNGAGKSTLLKIISRITEPTTGFIGVNGRVASLLEVGTGFHPELSGRENIFLNGAILGMSQSEVKRKFDEIVDFAEIDGFIDTPVKRYSSGMYVRLAFSVAAHLEADILLVDEVLAVGDSNFQKKCMGKMEDVSASGKTILFVSHNITAIENLCNKSIVLSKGRLDFSGSAKDGVKHYINQTVALSSNELNTYQRMGDGRGLIENVWFSDFQGAVKKLLRSGDDLSINVLVRKNNDKFKNILLNIGITTLAGDGVMHYSTETIGLDIPEVDEISLFTCKIAKLPLRGGSYSLNLFLKANGIIADYLVDALRFEVADGDYYGTGKLPSEGYPYYLPDYTWKLSEADPN
jgi:lipopolysaccharide transport system ATP-binding protein